MRWLAKTMILALVLSLFPWLGHSAGAQNAGGGTGRGRRGGGPPTLGLENGTLDIDTPDFTLRLVKSSQTIAALEPKGAKGYNNVPFDFTPADQLPARAGDGYNHLGDITFRIQQAGWEEGAWVDFSSSIARKPVIVIADAQALPGETILAAADLTPTISGARAAPPGGRARGTPPPTPVSDCPLQVTRSWVIDSAGRLVLHFAIKNISAAPVTVGALGIPVIFNNIITGRNLEQAHGICSFFDPYVGQDGGYLQVTRLSGAGPALAVVPETGTKTPFEAFRKINDNTQTSQTFEGAFEWMVHSQAYADNDWKNAQPWNPATSETLQPGQTTLHGLRFLVSPEIRDIEKTLAANKRPVAIGIPGYIIPADINAKLFLNLQGRKITGFASDPKEALYLSEGGTVATSGITPLLDPRPTKGGFLPFGVAVIGKAWGRARLTLTYDDGTTQAIHYYITKPAAEAVSDLGNFLFTKQWFDVPNDPFHRSPSIMTYDRQKNQIVTQDSRVWIAGLGDEGGSSWLTGAMKEFGQPKKEEVDKYAEFVDKVLWGQLQVSEGPQMYAVRKSLFFYDPQNPPDNFVYDPTIRWANGFPSWNRAGSIDDFSRGYDYPHVVAAYWAMYRLTRNNPGLVTAEKWEWYLDKAYQTTRYLTGGAAAATQTGRGRARGPGYTQFGLMEGDIFVFLLDDLKREGWNEQASDIETRMKRRADRWNTEPFPFGSEMAWDSTGQEEVYAWTTYFGYLDKAQVSLDSILGYMPTVPHWGYNGNARRYWDFQYGGAPGGGIERQLHHYGSGINAIPALAQYRQHPDDFYLLRIGYGGAMGALSNIDQEGFASAAFHSNPQNLRWDAYSGDYAQNFFGHAADAATYIINHPDFGWLSFGGNGNVDGDWVKVKTLDSFRRRIYIAPLGLYLTLDAGTFESVEINTKTNAVRVALSPKSQFTPNARLRIEQPAKIAGIATFSPDQKFVNERYAFTIPLQDTTTWLDLTAK